MFLSKYVRQNLEIFGIYSIFFSVKFPLKFLGFILLIGIEIISDSNEKIDIFLERNFSM